LCSYVFRNKPASLLLLLLAMMMMMTCTYCGFILPQQQLLSIIIRDENGVNLLNVLGTFSVREFSRFGARFRRCLQKYYKRSIGKREDIVDTLCHYLAAKTGLTQAYMYFQKSA